MTRKKTWHIRAAGLTLATSTALSLGLSGNAFAQEDGEGDTTAVSSAPATPDTESSSSSEENSELDDYKLKKWPAIDGFELEDNPELKARGCDDRSFNIAFVYDISGSVGKEGAKEYKKSTEKIIDSLAGRNVGVASFYMGDVSENPQPKPEIVTKKNKGEITEKINQYIIPGRGEDWGLVLKDVHNNNKKYKYDLVVFIADGIPARGFGDSPNVANEIKKSGTRIVTVGAGPQLLKRLDRSVSNLTMLSGPEKNKDWFLGDWDKLTKNLLNITESVSCVSTTSSTSKPSTPSSTTEKPTTTEETTTPEKTTPKVSPSTVSTTVNSTATNTVTETNNVDEVETETSTETEKSVETNTETVKKTETVKPAPETTTTSSVETQVVDKPYPVQQPAQPVYGPKVETGGEVDGLGLLGKIKSILFR